MYSLRTFVAGNIADGIKNNWPRPHTEALVARMLDYDGAFHAFPDQNLHDSDLIRNALIEQAISDVTALLCGLAAVYAPTDPDKTARCKQYILDYSTHCWNINVPDNEKRVNHLGRSQTPSMRY